MIDSLGVCPVPMQLVQCHVSRNRLLEGTVDTYCWTLSPFFLSFFLSIFPSGQYFTTPALWTGFHHFPSISLDSRMLQDFFESTNPVKVNSQQAMDLEVSLNNATAGTMAATTPQKPKGLGEMECPVHSGDEQVTDSDESAAQWDNQGEGLPTYAHVTFPGVVLLKHDTSNVAQWKRDIVRALRMLGVEQVIRRDLRRPKKTSHYRNIWDYWSRGVARWITETLEGATRDEIEAGVKSWAKNADDLIRDIEEWKKSKDIGTAMHVNDLLIKWDEMERSDFDNASDYLAASQDLLDKLNKFKCRPFPYFCYTRRLRELEDEFTHVAFLLEENKRIIPGNMTYWTYMSAFNQLKAIADIQCSSSMPSDNPPDDSPDTSRKTIDSKDPARETHRRVQV